MMTSQQIKWYLASDRSTPADGTSGRDMSVALVGLASAGHALYSTAPGCLVQLFWPATGAPTGAFGLAESADDVHFSIIALPTGSAAPTQPTGSADNCAITLADGVWEAPYLEVTWTPSSGGTGAVCGGFLCTKQCL